MKTKVVIELSGKRLKVYIGHSLAVRDLSEADSASISAALNDIILKNNRRLSNLDVYLVLSRNAITVRRIELPSQDAKEIEQMLGLYIVRQVPHRKEEICWAWQNLGFDGIGSTRLILAVALKNVFKSIANSLTSVNILPESVLMSSQGLLHYVSNACKDKSLLSSSYFILDIDSDYSDLVLAHYHKLGSSVVIPQGAQRLDDPRERERFCTELKQALAALSSEIPEAKCERMFLTGAAGGYISIIREALADSKIDIKYVSAKEYDGFIASGVKDVSLSSVLGFAWHVAKEDIKFSVPEIQIKRDMKIKMQQLTVLSVCLAYIMMMLGGIGLVKLGQKQSCTAALIARAEEMKRNAGELEDIVNNFKVIRQYTDTQSDVLFYLYNLIKICPGNITITHYNWEMQKQFSFKGYAPQISDVLAFTDILRSTEVFKGAQNRYTRRKKVKDREMVDFDISVK
ncbi:MAG: hypothetical protein PHV77_05975 [Candidatus Omnitrophica bacterium]|nr:hypothetical protein [Candidatus Omnitrophota bacterium]